MTCGRSPSSARTNVDFSEGLLVGYRWYDAKDQQPLFAFGHGLSYTTFAYDKLKTHPLTPPAASTSVRLRVKNIGGRAGTETVQIYLGNLPAAVETEPKKLAGFSRVTLAPGEQRDVDVEVSRRSLSYWDTNADRWVTPRGDVPVYAGSSSRDLRLTGRIRVLPARRGRLRARVGAQSAGHRGPHTA